MMEINSSLVCRLKGERMHTLPSGALLHTFSHYRGKKTTYTQNMRKSQSSDDEEKYSTMQSVFVGRRRAGKSISLTLNFDLRNFKSKWKIILVFKMRIQQNPNRKLLPADLNSTCDTLKHRGCLSIQQWHQLHFSSKYLRSIFYNTTFGCGLLCLEPWFRPARVSLRARLAVSPVSQLRGQFAFQTEKERQDIQARADVAIVHKDQRAFLLLMYAARCLIYMSS